MNKSARFKRSSLVTTAIAVGILYAGAWRTEADSLICSDKSGFGYPGARRHHRARAA